MQREAKARAREAQCRELGLKDHKGAGQEVIAHTKTQQGLKLKKIGNASNGRSICEGQGGKLFVVAHDGTVLKTSYVKATEAYNKGEKVQGKIKNKEGKLINKQYAIVQKNYDKHGRSVVVDDKGQYHIMAQDGTILSNEYVQKSNKADAIKSDTKTARTETIGMLSAQLDSAQKAFDQQMKEDGWAGDVADGVSILWGSKNRASEVRKDLAQYRNTINELKNCKTDQEFKAKFKEKFGVEYNANAVADYLMKPTAGNYRKAFGTKQPIGERVAKYNESQQTGAEVVKTTTKVAGAIALTAATVATGGAAGVVAGMAVAAGSAIVADVAVDVSDRVSSEEGLKDGELTEIVKDAAVDGVIAGATFGVGKALGAGYKAYKGVKVANQAASVAEKAVAKTAANATEQAAANAERAVATAEQAAQKAVAKAESTTAKEVAKNTAREAAQEAEQKVASTVEKAVAKAEGKTAETGLAKVEGKAAENVAVNSQKATTASAELTSTEEAVADAVADTAVGAGAEYVENGEVTLEGTLTNMAMGSVGLAGEKIGSKIKGKFHKSGSPDVAPTGGSHKSDGLDAPKDGPHKTNTTEDVNTQKTSEKTQADTDNKTHQTDESKGTETKNKTQNTENTQQANQQSHSADENVHTMNEQEIKQAIDELEPKLSEAQVANDLKEKFDDFLNDNSLNILEIRDNVRQMILKAHPDRGGSNDLFNAVNELKNAKTPAEIRQAKQNLKTLLDEKSVKLSEYKQQMNELRPEAKAETKVSDNTQKSEKSKATEESKAADNTHKEEPKTDKTSNANNGTKLSDEINETFGYRTRQKLETLQEGQSVVLEKGEFRYTVKNENGEIKIVKKQGNVNFDIPMSNRTPAGESGRVSMNDALSPESKKVYRDSYGAYLETKDKKIMHNATDMITEDNLLHGTNLDALLGEGGILDNGLVPREFSGNARAAFADGSVPNTLTPYCTDVWDVHGSQSIRDYFDPRSSHWANRGESNFLSNTGNSNDSYRAAVMVVLDKKSMHPDLLNNSFNVNPNGRSPLIRDGGIGGIGDGIHDYPTHRAIPMGAPANAIDRIIVDTRRLSPEQLGALRDKIAANGLDIDIYDMNGNLLMAA